MPTKKRKTRKMRGSRLHGYGQVGQHRGVGQRGGHGKAGYRKGKWTHTIKYEPERLRKHGFKRPIRKEVSTINVGKLDEQIGSLVDNKQVEKTKKGIKVYLNRLGYDKLLGKGQVTHPLIVQVRFCSESAAEKIEKAGGKILGTKI